MWLSRMEKTVGWKVVFVHILLCILYVDPESVRNLFVFVIKNFKIGIEAKGNICIRGFYTFIQLSLKGNYICSFKWKMFYLYHVYF